MGENDEMGKNNLIEQDKVLLAATLPCLLTLFDVGLDPWDASSPCRLAATSLVKWVFK